ncbi:MAG: type IV pilus twitching motility protein PilT [Myxococcota bacterium]|nr:type IV pilus twitching motility protein PilT [Myxococcota bacterium]
MARIDKFIDALVKRGADRVVLQSGEKVSLVFDGTPRPVTASVLHNKPVRNFVKEVAPPELSEELAQDGEHRFAYDSPCGPVWLEVRQTPDAIRVVITPKEPEAAPPERAPRKAPTPIESPAAASPPTTAPVAQAAPVAQPVPVEATAPAGGQQDGKPVTPGVHTAEMDALFRQMCSEGCSDLHLSSDCPPLFRKDGDIVNLGSGAPNPPEKLREMLYSITPPRRRTEFETCGDSDFSYEIPGLGRFRCNLFEDRKGIGGVFRVIPSEILTAEDLGLSEFILKLCHLKKGLVVVTGPTGSGKSTTLAAMIDYINRNVPGHIITVEDPIEFVHPNKQCLINQREIGNNTKSFSSALRAALREDPDIVLVGEMRDLETVEIAIETAETGHLVFGTLHTNTAPSTVDRVIDQFPTDRQSQIRTMLASSLKGVIAQTLCKKKGGGRAAAMEVLIANHAVSNLIREGKTFQIGSIMQTGRKLGMVTLNDALLDLVVDGRVDPEEALNNAPERAEFTKLLQLKKIPVKNPEPE